MAQRKIGFFSLNLRNEESEWNVKDILVSIFSYVSKQTKKGRKIDISDDRICFLDYYTFDESEGIMKLMLISAKHGYRAPLVNRKTTESRENPKTKDEGEQVKTHLLIKFKDGDVFAFLESGSGVLSMKFITDYINKSIASYNANHRRDRIDGYIGFDMIARDDFKDALDNMLRVTLAEVYVDKSILGSDALNFSNRTYSAQQEITLSVKPKKGQSIKDAVYDFLIGMTGSRQEIKRIRVKGKLTDKGESVIDTAFIIKKEFVEVQQNEDTGEYNTQDMFTQLEKLAN